MHYLLNRVKNALKLSEKVLETLLGLSWTPLGTLWGGIFGPVWHFVVTLERPRALWGSLVALFGRSWGALGTLLGRSTALLGTIGRLWDVQTVPQTLQLPFKAPQKATQSVPKAFQEPCKGFKKLEISRRDRNISFLVS